MKRLFILFALVPVLFLTACSEFGLKGEDFNPVEEVEVPEDPEVPDISTTPSEYFTWTLINGNTEYQVDGFSAGYEDTTEISIPASYIGVPVTTIGAAAFATSDLVSVVIPDSATTIGSYAFEECYLTSLSIPASVTSIGDRIVFDCESLTSISVSASNDNYSSVDGVLFNKAKTELLAYPIGNTAATYTIPDTVNTITDYAFNNAAHLTTVTFPEDGLTSIGEYAFCGAGLVTVTIGTGVTTIGQEAFNDCFDLDLLTINTTTPPSLGVNAFLTTIVFSIEVPAASVAAYEAAAGWSSFADEIVAQPVPLNLTMISIPTGSFKRDGTASIHTVSAFKMSEKEITREQFLSVVGTDPSITANSSGLTDPVQNVTWFDAVEFCNMLSADEGLTEVYTITGRTPATGYPITSATVTVSSWSANGYRLPTDMEWRWAAMGATSDARAGDIVGGVNTGGYTKGYAGSTEALGAQVSMGTCAVYGYGSGATGATTTNGTSPVGSKTENELDLYDMTGNVSEWVWDLYVLADGYPAGDWTDYHGSDTGTVRLALGGNWFNWANFCPIAIINTYAPGTKAKNIGFRVVHP